MKRIPAAYIQSNLADSKHVSVAAAAAGWLQHKFPVEILGLPQHLEVSLLAACGLCSCCTEQFDQTTTMQNSSGVQASISQPQND